MTVTGFPVKVPALESPLKVAVTVTAFCAVTAPTVKVKSW